MFKMNLFVLQLEEHHDTISQCKYSLSERGTWEALPRRGVPGSVSPHRDGKDAAVGPAQAGMVQPPVPWFNATSAPLTHSEARSRRWQQGFRGRSWDDTGCYGRNAALSRQELWG